MHPRTELHKLSSQDVSILTCKETVLQSGLQAETRGSYSSCAEDLRTRATNPPRGWPRNPLWQKLILEALRTMREGIMQELNQKLAALQTAPPMATVAASPGNLPSQIPTPPPHPTALWQMGPQQSRPMYTMWPGGLVPGRVMPIHPGGSTCGIAQIVLVPMPLQ